MYCPNCGKPVDVEFYASVKFCPRCFHSEKKSLMVELMKRLGSNTFRFQMKYRLIAEKLFNWLETRGFKCTEKKQVGSEHAPAPYLYGKFKSPMKSPKTIEAKVEYLKPMARIHFELVYKEGGLLGRGKESKKYAFTLNPDKYLDDSMIMKDEAALQHFLNGYFETLGIP